MTAGEIIPMDSVKFLGQISETGETTPDGKLLEVENKFGHMLVYKRLWDKKDINYLKKMERELRKETCGPCGVAAGKYLILKPRKVADIKQCREKKTLVERTGLHTKPVSCNGCRCLALKRSIRWLVKSRGIFPDDPGSTLAELHFIPACTSIDRKKDWWIL